MKPSISYWGANLRTAELPQAVFETDLDTDAIVVLAALLDLEKSRYAVEKASIKRIAGSVPAGWSYPAFCSTKHTTLEKRTGFSPNPVKSGLRKLKEVGWIKPERNHSTKRNKGGKFPCATYTFTIPGSLIRGSFLPVAMERKAVGNLLWKNGVKYFTFPRDMLLKTDQPWSLSKMKSAEKRLYFGLCCLANKARGIEYDTTMREIAKLTGNDIRTVFKNLLGLRKLGLVWVDGTDGADGLEGVTPESVKEARDKSLRIRMCDPYTGLPLHVPCDDVEADDANYKTTAKGVTRRAVLNNSPEEVEKIIRELVDGPIRTQGNGDLQIQCPFHSDDNPSLSVGLARQGCWRCWGCKQTGNFSDLIMGLTGCTRVESMQKIGNREGKEVHFQRPDSEAEAIYRYRDKEDTKTLKEVIRYPNREDGSKDIRQRRPVAGGYRWDTEGVKPTLYNVHLLRMGAVAVICEGEKDCDTVTSLGLRGKTKWGSGPVIGVTSGGATSWDASLVEELRSTNVVVMPDNDEPGRKYADEVKASLVAEGIECREVTFAQTGCKDVTEFLKTHRIEELNEMIGGDWVHR